MAAKKSSKTQIDVIEAQGSVFFDFQPRVELADFIQDKKTIRWLEIQKGYNSLAKNSIIKGDNLAAMAALRVSWLLNGEEDAFDIVYIDPPYNVGGKTGYKNSWKGESEGTFGWAGNHGKFLDFMEPRLRMAKLLMKDEGVIIVSICDAEYHRLLFLMEEVFGMHNHIGTFIWDKKQGSPSDYMTTIHEYIMCFAKNEVKSWKFEQLKPGCMEIIQKAKELSKVHSNEVAMKKLKQWISQKVEKEEITKGLASYCLIHPETGRVFASNPSCAQDDNGSRCRKQLRHPITNTVCPLPSKGWKWKEEKIDEMVDYENVFVFKKGYICGDFLFGQDHTTVPRKVAYLDDMTKQKPSSIIRTMSAGHGDLPPGVTFPTPKPVDLLEVLLNFVPSNQVRVLDFFAGSGTTAHAVHKLNKLDDGNRTYVIIEEIESTIQKAIIPRMEYLAGRDSFAYYSIVEKDANSVDLFMAFRRHSEKFVKALHCLDVELEDSVEGVRVIGFNSTNRIIVATLAQELRDGNSRSGFRKELACLANAVFRHKAAKIILYRIELESNGQEEPWVGINSDIFSGTSCQLMFVSLPSAIIKAWQETLIALESV